MKNFRDWFLTEAPYFNDEHKKLGVKQSNDERRDLLTYEAAQVGGTLLSSLKYNKYQIELFKQNNTFRVFALKNDEIVGVLMSIMTKGYLPHDIPTVSSVHIYEEYQGQGIGYQMYKLLIDNVGALMSDSTLTGSDGGGSFRMWEKLGSYYRSYIYDTDTKTLELVNGFDKSMMDSDVRFVVSKKSLESDDQANDLY